MRKTIPMLLLAILLATASIQAQQSDQAQQSEVTPAPCVVFGAVRNPGRFELRRPVRLAEILAIAGGVSEQASGAINIIHTERTLGREISAQGQNSKVPSEVYNITGLKSSDPKANPYIEVGDVVIVTESDPIYVTGSVVSPRAIYPKEAITLMQAIKMAGGLRGDTNPGKVVIYRPKGDQVEHITVDLNEIRKHRTKDFILQLRDIVDVGGVGQIVPVNRYPTFDSRPLIPPGYRVIY